MSLDEPLIDCLPQPAQVRSRLGDALREVELLRRLLRLSERAEEFRRSDCHRQVPREAAHAC
jgi:hypothetical protein